ncbi:MAG: hypothetical protein O3C65_15270 [Proteobacteria bacterium]|nr:hypothetical protein [Pseudomonadota bacterium]MDA1060035.1 hypothetical protein [Pseudomonadota bacterium]
MKVLVCALVGLIGLLAACGTDQSADGPRQKFGPDSSEIRLGIKSGFTSSCDEEYSISFYDFRDIEQTQVIGSHIEYIVGERSRGGSTLTVTLTPTKAAALPTNLHEFSRGRPDLIGVPFHFDIGLDAAGRWDGRFAPRMPSAATDIPYLEIIGSIFRLVPEFAYRVVTPGVSPFGADSHPALKVRYGLVLPETTATDRSRVVAITDEGESGRIVADQWVLLELKGGNIPRERAPFVMEVRGREVIDIASGLMSESETTASVSIDRRNGPTVTSSRRCTITRVG